MKPVQKCIIPTCKNKLGTVDFFSVPSTGHRVFKRWTEIVNLSGERNEKICADQFTKKDFITYTRAKLKEKAIPKLHIPEQSPKLRPVKGGKACCIEGCNSTKPTFVLQRFPSDKKLLRKWKKALGLGVETSTCGLRVCEKHFSKFDCVIVTSRYLKCSAVPSKKIQPKRPRRILQIVDLPEHLKIHNYTVYACRARSNRICYVKGCFSRKEGNIKLHQFPAPSDARFKEWIRILKCTKLPTKNSTVCSLHFKASEYIGHGPRLKPTAMPSPVEIRVVNIEEEEEETDDDSPSSDESNLNQSEAPTLDHPEQNEIEELHRPASQSPIPDEPNNVDSADESNQDCQGNADFEFIAV